MLSLLHIENIAVIQSADIEFDKGFNVLTGETGAGKSIVIDALSAVIGERTSRELIRTGASSALVSAIFSELPDLSWFQENGICPDENGQLILQREIFADGKNTCRVGGRPVTVSQLKVLGSQLVNIHGQHDGQQLLDEHCHLAYLDSFGVDNKLNSAYREAYAHLSGISREIAALQMDEAEKSRRIDTLKFQIEELERANLKIGEEESLLSRRALLRNAGKFMSALEDAHLALSGDEDRDGAVSLLTSAEYALSAVGDMSGELAELAGKVSELRYAADDAAELVRDARASFDFSPDELDDLESRLDILHRLKKKYGSSAERMLAYLEKCRTELDGIQYADDTIARLQKNLEQAKKQALEKGQALSAARKKAALELQVRIQKELRDLDMPKVRFEVDFAPKSCADGMDATGMDEVQFLMSANVGEQLRPIQKIASGGELARIMLALKNVLAENDLVTTLVFDEVDTGVSGRAAQKVAEKMAAVAGSKQVLCVTHLPQIAAMADTHFSVEKGERSGRTYTDVERLDTNRRCEELARLTGGEHITDALMQSARELLYAAEVFKQSDVDKKS